jgi:hypothetical protein
MTPETQKEHNNTGIYIYCLTKFEPSLENLLDNEATKSAYFYINYNQLFLLVSKVSLSEFQGHISEEKMDMEWLQSKAVAHEKVVEAMMKKTAILPFSFGMVVPDITQAKKFLQDNYAHLLECLNKFGDCSEWNLEGSVKEELLEKEITNAPEILELQEKIKGASTGLAHMLQKRLESLIEKHKAELINRFEEMLIEETGSIPIAEKPNERKTPRRDLVIDMVYLITKARKDGFIEAVTRVNEKNREFGFQLKLSGPWPAYSFIPQITSEDGVI